MKTTLFFTFVAKLQMSPSILKQECIRCGAQNAIKHVSTHSWGCTLIEHCQLCIIENHLSVAGTTLVKCLIKCSANNILLHVIVVRKVTPFEYFSGIWRCNLLHVHQSSMLCRDMHLHRSGDPAQSCHDQQNVQSHRKYERLFTHIKMYN